MTTPQDGPHLFAVECPRTGLTVALSLEPASGDLEGAARLQGDGLLAVEVAESDLEVDATADVLAVPCPACGDDHGIPRVTAERYAELTAPDDEEPPGE